MWVSHCRSAPGVLAAVQKAIAKHKAKKVTIAGHSLGTSPSDPFLLVLHPQCSRSTTHYDRCGNRPLRRRISPPAHPEHHDAFRGVRPPARGQPALCGLRRRAARYAVRDAHQQQERRRADPARPLPRFPPSVGRGAHRRGWGVACVSW